VGYWQIGIEDQERLAKKRADVAKKLGDKALLVLFSGEQSDYSVGRFYAEPWFRELAELRESGCVLMCAQDEWMLYVPEPSGHSMIWEDIAWVRTGRCKPWVFKQNRLRHSKRIFKKRPREY
jgi:hypothetical protein